MLIVVPNTKVPARHLSGILFNVDVGLDFVLDVKN